MVYSVLFLNSWKSLRTMYKSRGKEKHLIKRSFKIPVCSAIIAGACWEGLLPRTPENTDRCEYASPTTDYGRSMFQSSSQRSVSTCDRLTALGHSLPDLPFHIIMLVVNNLGQPNDVFNFLATCAQLSIYIPSVFRKRCMEDLGLSCAKRVWKYLTPFQCYRAAFPFRHPNNKYFINHSNCYGAMIRCRIADDGIILEQAQPPPDDSYKLLKNLANNIKQPIEIYDETTIYQARFFTVCIVKPEGSRQNGGVYSAIRTMCCDQTTGKLSVSEHGIISVEFPECESSLPNMETLWEREFGQEIKIDNLQQMILNCCYPSRSMKLRSSCFNNPKYTLTPLSRPSGFHREYLLKPDIYTSQCGVNHGQEFTMISYSNTNHLDEDGEFLIGQNITGDANVPAGKVTFEINLTHECPLENLPDQYGSMEEMKSFIKETLKSKQQGRASGSCPRPFNDKFSIYKEKYPSYACQTRGTYIAAFCGYGQVAHSGYIEPEFIPIIAVIFDSDAFGIFWPDLQCFIFYYRQCNIVV